MLHVSDITAVMRQSLYNYNDEIILLRHYYYFAPYILVKPSPDDGSIRTDDGSIRTDDGSIRTDDGSIRTDDGSIRNLLSDAEFLLRSQ
jgi:hypothetical protein